MDSPFASQLGTNYCPTDTELGQIKCLLVEPCLELKRLDAEIAVVRKALDKLTEDRDTLGAYVDAHRTLMSPVRQLPLDVIEEIFIACLPTHRNCVMSAQEAPVILGRICSSWRTISLSTPRLWSRLHIVEPKLSFDLSYISASDLVEAKSVQRQEVAKAWLQRSGTCPLSISLESHFDHDAAPPLSPSPTPSSPNVFLIVVSFASRWQTISLRIHQSAVQMLLRLTEADVPLLKSLTINERPDSPHPEWNLSQARVFLAPALSRFYLSASNVPTAELPLRWGNLTALTLLSHFLSQPAWGQGSGGTQTCQVILDVLGRCSQLRICTVLVDEPSDGYVQDSVVECRFLHTLRITSSSCPLQTSGRLLSRLSMPDLQDFELHGYHRPPHIGSTSDADTLASALAASTRLKSVNIDTAIFSTLCFLEFLRSLPPTVQCFQFTGPGGWAVLDDDVFKELEASPDRTTPLPGLEELTVTDCHEVSDEMLLRFIVSRTPTLRRINLQFNRQRQVDILPSLQTFIQAGLQASLAYPPLPQFSPWEGLLDTQPLG
ncbi:hypothetical protein K438DRAFT_916302 [Mycena galopus ATCC 62051]|nr:hypothetical protein K438DRAFT_916302 [Mycena galopus ATCC 62051]